MVGFGGGSSYLAIMVLAGLSYQQIPAQALTCNIIVAGGGFWLFYKAGHFRANKVLPFVACSIPMAYLGGRMLINKELFCILLGLSLLAVALRLFMRTPQAESSKDVSQKRAWAVGLPIGALLGLLAGVVGIGGGIFLSPILLLMRWANAKEAAASASFFIVVNSAAGLVGQFQKGATDFSYLIPLALAVLLGGQIGARLGAFHLPKVALQKGLAGLVFYVSVRLILGAV